MAPYPDPYQFADLLDMGRSELRHELATIVGELCTELELCAYIRSTDGRSNEYFEHEGHRDALTERKWLVIKLLDTIDTTSNGD